MATVSGQQFFGGKVPPPVAPTPVAQAPHPLDGFGISDKIKADFAARSQTVAQAKGKVQAGQQSLGSGIFQSAGQAAGLVGDVATEGLKAITPQPVKDAAKQAISSVAQTAPVQTVVQNYTAWKQQHPEAAANLEAAVNIGSLLPIGEGAGIAGKAVGEAGAVGAKVAGEAATLAGRAVKGTGEAVYKSAFTPTVGEAEKILSHEAKAPFLTRVTNTLTGTADASKPVLRADTALAKGLAGTEKMVGVQARRESQRLWNDKIAPAVKGSTDRMTKDELFAPAVEMVGQTVDPTRKIALQSALNALEKDYQGVTSFSLDEAQALKRDIAKFVPSKMYRGQDVANEVKTLQHEMATAIRQKTYNSLKDVNIKKDYLDYANLSELENVGIKAISEKSFKGGFGSFWSGAWDAVTTPVKTIGGQVLYHVGNKLEFVGQKGIKRFGEYLQTKGFNRATTHLENNPPSLGLAMKNVADTGPSVSPENIAKNVDTTDVGVIKEFLAKPQDPNVYIKAHPLIGAMGINKLSHADQVRFLQEVLDNTGQLRDDLGRYTAKP